jgi:kinesin family member C2/C3
MVVSALDGYHACIFAYGQTGAGKSYTMTGPASDRGVNFRTLQALFAVAHERRSAYDYTFKVSMLEIYNENVLDLLSTASLSSAANDDKSLEIRQGPHGLHVPDANVEEVRSIEEVEALMSRGEHNRTVGFTNCNEHSSRSHSLLLIELVGFNKLTGSRSRGRLVLVDLAGSERVSKSGVTGVRMKEAQSINKWVVCCIVPAYSYKGYVCVDSTDPCLRWAM